MNAASVGRLPWVAEILLVAPILRKVRLSVKPTNRNTGDGGETGVAVVVAIDTGGRTDGPLWRLFERRRERLFRPFLFALGRVPSLENVGNRTLRDLRLLIGHDHPANLDDRREAGGRQADQPTSAHLFWLTTRETRGPIVQGVSG